MLSLRELQTSYCVHIAKNLLVSECCEQRFERSLQVNYLILAACFCVISELFIYTYAVSICDLQRGMGMNFLNHTKIIIQLQG